MGDEPEYPRVINSKQVVFWQEWGERQRDNPVQRQILAQVAAWLEQNPDYSLEAITMSADDEYVRAHAFVVSVFAD